MEDSKIQFKITVDVKRALEVLSENVFTSPEASIRELIANGIDSLLRMPPNKLAHAEIRILSNYLEGVLSISDNGKGMTETEAKKLLGTIFGTGKISETEAIGRFGIGFYACFPLCEKIEVFTKSLNETSKGTHIYYMGGHTLYMKSRDIENHGTTVKLYLRNEYKRLLNESELATIIYKYCNFVEIPIYIGTGWTIVNSINVPWYRNATVNDLRDSLKKFFNIKEPLAIFPLSGKIGKGKLNGVLYIPNSREKCLIRLYSKRILVTEEDQSLLDEGFLSFLGGIVDVEDLPLLISRDAIISNSKQVKTLKDFIMEKFVEGMINLAKKRNSDFIKLIAQHRNNIKKVCVTQPKFSEKIRDFIPFQSSLRATVTIPEYLANRSDHTVIFADDMTVGASLIPLYNQKNIEVLYMTDREDIIFRRDWKHNGERIKFKRLDEDPPVTISSTNSKNIMDSKTVEQSTIESLRQLFKSSIDEQLQLEVRALGPDAPPAILAIPDDDRKMLEILEIIYKAKEEKRFEELPLKIQEMASSGFLYILKDVTSQTIILNESNEIVEELIVLIKQPIAMKVNPNIDSLLAKFLYGQSLISSGIQLSNEKLAEISKNQTQVLTTLLKLQLSDRKN